MKQQGARVKEAERWLGQAERDLSAARNSARDGFHEWACFQAQQAGEKAAKAVLLFLGMTGRSSHSVLELLETAVEDRPELASLHAAAKLLDDQYLASRYPDATPGTKTPGARYQPEDSQTCITASESILTASTSIVRGSGSSSPS